MTTNQKEVAIRLVVAFDKAGSTIKECEVALQEEIERYVKEKTGKTVLWWEATDENIYLGLLVANMIFEKHEPDSLTESAQCFAEMIKKIVQQVTDYVENHQKEEK